MRNFDNTGIYEFASKMEMSSKQARHLADATEELVTAAKAAIKDLEELVAAASNPEGDVALGAIISYGRVAGYSNTPEANAAKVRQQAGRVEGIVSAL